MERGRNESLGYGCTEDLVGVTREVPGPQSQSKDSAARCYSTDLDPLQITSHTAKKPPCDWISRGQSPLPGRSSGIAQLRGGSYVRRARGPTAAKAPKRSTYR